MVKQERHKNLIKLILLDKWKITASFFLRMDFYFPLTLILPEEIAHFSIELSKFHFHLI